MEVRKAERREAVRDLFYRAGRKAMHRRWAVSCAWHMNQPNTIELIVDRYNLPERYCGLPWVDDKRGEVVPANCYTANTAMYVTEHASVIPERIRNMRLELAVGLRQARREWEQRHERD